VALGTANTAVTATVDIWREATASNYDGGFAHPAVTDTICGAGTCPTVTTGKRAAVVLTSWNSVVLAKGDILVFNATSADAVNVNLVLYVTKQ
jgi:hypothetical protein